MNWNLIEVIEILVIIVIDALGVYLARKRK